MRSLKEIQESYLETKMKIQELEIMLGILQKRIQSWNIFHQRWKQIGSTPSSYEMKGVVVGTAKFLSL